MRSDKEPEKDSQVEIAVGGNSSPDAKQKINRKRPVQRRNSTKAQFMQSSTRLKKRGRGTRERAKSVYASLEQFARAMKWHGFSPETISLDQAKQYFAHRIMRGISPGSLHSEASAIRNAMVGANRRHEAKYIFTTEALGIPPRTSTGKRKAIPEEVYAAALAKADEFTAPLMMLMRNVGLRLNEAISCKDSVSGWTELMGMESPAVDLNFGAKGGKNRIIYIHPEKRALVHESIAAIHVSTNGGRTHPMPSKSGATANRKLRDRMRKLGLWGEFSPHSLRAAFAVDQYTLYRAKGYNHVQACSRVALDLGHGKSRGRWVWSHYVGPTLGKPQK